MEALSDFYSIQPLWIWIALAAALLTAEVATSTGWLLWPSASAAVVGAICYFAPLPFPMALLLFAVVTIVSTLLGRKLTPRSEQAHGGDINDLRARLVGQRGRACTPFSEGEGRVLVDGKEWPATLDGGGDLADDAAIEVTGFSGARLSVRPAGPPPPGTP